jgi:hypothetical protein
VLKLVFAQFLQCLGKKRVGLIRCLVGQTRATSARTLLGDAFFKEAVKLPVELPKQLEFWGNAKHQCQVFLVLLTELGALADFYGPSLPFYNREKQ